MKRLYGPYAHRNRWRTVEYDYDTGARTVTSFDTREDALAVVERHEVESLAGDATSILADAVIHSAVRLPDDPAWVYVLFDENDLPVYVGVTGSPSARLAAHRGSKDYPKEFSYVAIVPTPFERRDALRVEAAMIRVLRTKSNRMLRPDLVWKNVAQSVPHENKDE